MVNGAEHPGPALSPSFIASGALTCFPRATLLLRFGFVSHVNALTFGRFLPLGNGPQDSLFLRGIQPGDRSEKSQSASVR
jgi:hypothetical protein